MATVNPEQAQADLEEISTRQRQAARESLRSPRWFVLAIAALVLVFNVAAELLDGQEFLLLAGYLALMVGLSLLAQRQRRARVHRSWYTPQRVLRSTLGMLLVIVAIGVTTVAAHLLLLWLPGLSVPTWLVFGLAQALAVLALTPLIERVCGWR